MALIEEIKDTNKQKDKPCPNLITVKMSKLQEKRMFIQIQLIFSMKMLKNAKIYIGRKEFSTTKVILKKKKKARNLSHFPISV